MISLNEKGISRIFSIVLECDMNLNIYADDVTYSTVVCCTRRMRQREPFHDNDHINSDLQSIAEWSESIGLKLEIG